MSIYAIRWSAFLIALVCLSHSLFAADTSLGWRSDGTGMYDVKNPLTQWGPDQNVAWKRDLPNWSNALPVVTDKYIFVTVEPTTLMCLNRADGSTVWTRDFSYVALEPESEREAIIKNLKSLEPAMREFREVTNQLNRAKRRLRNNQDNADALAEVEKLTARQQELQKQVQPLEKYDLPKTHGDNGYASPTPASDGQYIVALFGNGVVGCFDIQGNRQWMKLIEKSNGRSSWGHSVSPLIVGDTVVIQISDYIALNLKTGGQKWKLTDGPHWGSPVHTQIDGVDVMVTPGGKIVRISDGSVLFQGMPKQDYNSPLVHEGIIYFIEQDAAAYKLPTSLDQKEVEKLWEANLPKDRYYASPVIVNGVIYNCTRGEVLSLIDAKTGQVLQSKPMALQSGKGNNVFPSLIAAGDKIYVSSQNGRTAVLEPAREIKEIARNEMPAFRSTPIYVGDTMFLRTHKTLYCLKKQP